MNPANVLQLIGTSANITTLLVQVNHLLCLCQVSGHALLHLSPNHKNGMWIMKFV